MWWWWWCVVPAQHMQHELKTRAERQEVSEDCVVYPQPGSARMSGLRHARIAHLQCPCTYALTCRRWRASLVSHSAHPSPTQYRPHAPAYQPVSHPPPHAHPARRKNHGDQGTTKGEPGEGHGLRGRAGAGRRPHGQGDVLPRKRQERGAGRGRQASTVRMSESLCWCVSLCISMQF